jgi:outer membrane protein, heavy metal efflux system
MWSLLFVAALPAALPGAPDPLDLAALLRQAREANPALASARGRLAAAEAAPSQAEAPMDPMASIAYTNESLDELTLGEAEDSFLTLSWSQQVRYPGKRRLAGEVARREIDVQSTRVEQAERSITSRVVAAYADLYRVDRSTDILLRSRELLASLHETARARYEAGEGLLQNVLKARTEISLVDAEMAALRQERARAEASLRALLNAPGRSFGPAREIPPAAPLDLEALRRAALEHSPGIREAEAMARRDEARLDLARRELRPDFSWQAGYSYRGSLDPMVMGMIGVQLPLYRGRKQAQGVAQAGHELAATRADAEAARLGVIAEIEEIAARAGRAAELASLYEEAVLPQARASLESSTSAYGVGRVDFLTLLEDFSTVLRREMDLEAQRADHLMALGELQGLTGLPLVAPAEAAP